MPDLSGEMLRIAAALPVGDPHRRKILASLVEAREKEARDYTVKQILEPVQNAVTAMDAAINKAMLRMIRSDDPGIQSLSAETLNDMLKLERETHKKHMVNLARAYGPWT